MVNQDIQIGADHTRQILWINMPDNNGSLAKGDERLKEDYRVDLSRYNMLGPYRVFGNGSGDRWEVIYHKLRV